MLWILGLVLGAWIGGVLGELPGALLGALLGLLIVHNQRQRAAAGSQPDRLRQLEHRVDALEAELAILRGTSPEAAQGRSHEQLDDGFLPLQGGRNGGLGEHRSPPAERQGGAETPGQVGDEGEKAGEASSSSVSIPHPHPTPPLEGEGEQGQTVARNASRLPTRETEPGELDALYARARAWLFGGNTLVRVGVLVLFFGLAFLARYAAEAGLVPVELRLAGIAAGGVALLVAGWRLRGRRAGYALSLQGGGVAVLYLTVFAALRLYDLLPAGLAFALLLAIVALAALLAILQDAPALAVVGSAGGFVAPILASTGAGSHVQLFGYYTLLNAGVLVIAWKKAWRILNLVGFAFTFLISLAWGARYYQPAFFASTEPFLITFFLMYLAAALFYAFRHAPDLKHYVDGTLVFGLPVVAFGLQAGLVRDIPFALAWSALALGGLYVLLARWLHGRRNPTLALLVEAFLALGIAFLTLAIPLALEGKWTAAAWALEGAALFWVGQRQGRKLASAAGLLLQVAAGVAFGEEDGLAEHGRGLPLANSHCLGALLLALAGLFAARLAHAGHQPWRWLRPAGWLMLAWGVLWWLAGGLTELSAQLSFRQMPAAMVTFFAASAALAAWAQRRLDWDGLALAGLLGLPGMGLSLLLTALHNNQSPASHGGWWAWPVAIGLHFLALRRIESARIPQRLLPAWHGLGLWAIAWALGWELAERMDVLPGNSWSLAMPAVAGCLALGAVLSLAERPAWPVGPWRRAYLGLGVGGVALFLLAWSIGVNSQGDGGVEPLPYLPLMNPLDLALVAIALGLLAWQRALARLDPPLPWAGVVLPAAGAVGFVAASAAVLRAVHHLAGVPYDLSSLLDSETAQASLSLFWGAAGLALMLTASRRGLRPLWLAGAGLMGLVVAKLFLVDMAASGTVARIVSFIGAGLLLLVVGYFSPLPPKEDRA
jgi:uncharacterized membrane protein